MAGDIQMDTHQVDGYARAMKAAPQRLKKELIIAVNRTTTEGEARSKRYVPTDTHHLQRSITMVAARDMAGGIRGAWGTNVPYAKVMEEGRGAGTTMPPAGALLGWMARHGIDESQEFVVRRAIGRNGIVGKRYMAKARAEVDPLADREIRTAVRRTLASIRARR